MANRHAKNVNNFPVKSINLEVKGQFFNDSDRLYNIMYTYYLVYYHVFVIKTPTITYFWSIKISHWAFENDSYIEIS